VRERGNSSGVPGARRFQREHGGHLGRHRSGVAPAAGEPGLSEPGFTHSGWWTEDGRYLFLHDELDERDLGLNTTVRVFDMSDLRAPALAGSWVGPTRAIDHNGYVRGNRYYFSNYSEG
jgi:hypothetical protein